MTKETQIMEKSEEKELAVAESEKAVRIFTPRVDIYEIENETVLLADMPGVDETSVEVTLEKNLLTIVGRVLHKSLDGFELAYAEYRVGNYKRTFAVSDDIDRENIEATVKNGVLRLVLPKSEAVKARRIEVQSSQ
jgi:HSP20 family molecular chaperone IbpA